MCGFFFQYKTKKVPLEEYDPQKLNEMGHNYEKGMGVQANPEHAFRCYQASADKGDSTGLYNTGRMLLQGIGTQRDAGKGLDLILKSISMGNDDAKLYLGIAYHEGKFVPKDNQRALALLRPFADKGNMDAAYYVGVMLKNGDGVEISTRDAFKYLKMADRLGHPKAFEEIYGRPKGNEVPNNNQPRGPSGYKSGTDDYDYIHTWAERGNLVAMYDLAVLYRHGRGVEVSMKDSVYWLTKAADIGYSRAMAALGHVYATTNFGFHSPPLAVEWYVRAAIAGRDEFIAYAIDEYRMMSDKTEKAVAFEKIRSYDSKGHQGPYAELAHMYVERDGVDPTPTKMSEWFKSATENNLNTKFRCVKEPMRSREKQNRVKDKYVTRTYHWKYPVGDRKLTADYELTIRSSDYYKLVDSEVERWPRRIEGRVAFITPNDPYVKEIAKYIKKITRGLSDMDRANCAIKFVQSMPYSDDMDQFGIDDYTMYPLEMLWTKTGDCEDYAILFISIMMAMGFDMAMLHVKCPDSSHIAAGLCHRQAKGYMVPCGKKNYCYCEATSRVSGDPDGTCKAIGVKDEEYVVTEVIPIN